MFLMAFIYRTSPIVFCRFFYKFLRGTFESNEVYPNVTIRGYLVFDDVHENAKTVRIIATKHKYPVYDTLEFIVPLRIS